MSAAHHLYRFETQAQWAACLLEGIERDSRAGRSRLHAFNPYAVPPRLLPSAGGHAPAAGPFDSFLWRDDQGRLHRLAGGDDVATSFGAPAAIALAGRVVAGISTLWAAGVVKGTVECFDAESLTRRPVVSVSEDTVVDLADAGHDGVLALTGHGCDWHCVHVDCAGHVVASVPLSALLRPAALAYLHDSRQIVILDYGHSGAWLRWYPATGGSESLNLFTPPLGVCFHATQLGSDGRERLYVAGQDRLPNRMLPHVIVIDAGANSVGDIPLEMPATGVAAGRAAVAVTDASGLRVFNQADAVPDFMAQSRGTVVTPMLRSPVTSDGRRWLRVEATGAFPAGTTIEIAYATTTRQEDAKQWNATIGDAKLSRSQRLQALRDGSASWSPTVVFQGSAAAAAFADVPIAAPLFDARAEYLAVIVTLLASSGATLPMLTRLDVLYPGRTLMDRLPAIYRRTESAPHDFMRALVGVLETTTQTLDGRIGAMGSFIHPRTAPAAWLDFVARWIGLPWDDALTPEQKRAIAADAALILTARGTRAGVEALLGALVSGSPRRYRVVDATADNGFAITAGAAGCGSRLPTMLGGLAADASELGSRAVLGRLRLPCTGIADDGIRHLVGRISVHIAATAAERRAWEPWMPSMINLMVPAMTRLDLHWVSPTSLQSDETSIQLVDLPDQARIGTDAVTGHFKLPDGATSLSATGADLGARLH